MWTPTALWSPSSRRSACRCSPSRPSPRSGRARSPDMFQGALPESELKRFAEALLKMAGGAMPAADMLAEAKRATEAGEHGEAGAIYSELLQDDPASPDAWGGLIRALIALGQEDQAQDALASVPGGHSRPCRDRRRPQRPGPAGRGPRRPRPARRAAGPSGRRPGRSSGPLRPRHRAECHRGSRRGGGRAARHHQARPKLE